MFDAALARRRRPAWKSVFIVASVCAHGVAVAALLVHSMWAIERIAAPDRPVTMHVPRPMTAPPPPPPGGTSRAPTSDRRIVREPVQPTAIAEDDVTISEDGPADGHPDGQPDGVLGGDPDGRIDGVLDSHCPRLEDCGPGIALERDPCEADHAPAWCDPPAPPPVVSPTALEARRTAGNTHIVPDQLTMRSIGQAAIERVVAVARICLDTRGVPVSVVIEKSSGFAAYDQRIRDGMASWRYQPFAIDGKPAPVCSLVTFVYRQQ